MNGEYAKFLMQKTRKDYNEIAEEFSATRKTMWPELADLDKYVKEGDRVLDIGCGNGKLLGYLADKKKSFSYSGLDISEKLIKIAKDFYLEAELPSKEFKIFDGVNIPYPENSFDVVYCLATLPHLPGREMQIKFLENVRKTAKPGAQLIITCWNLWQFKFIPFQLKMIVNFITDKIFGKGLPRYPNMPIKEQSNYKESTFLSKLLRFWPLGNGGQHDWGDFYIPWKKRGTEPIYRYYHSFTITELNSILKKAGWETEEIGYKNRNGKKNFNLFAVVRK